MCVGTKTLAIDNARSDRQNVFKRPAKFNANEIACPVKPEQPVSKPLGKQAAELFVGACDRECRGETARDFSRKARARQNGLRGFGQYLRQDIAHKFTAGLLDALCAQNDWLARTHVGLEAFGNGAYVLRWRDHEQDIAGCEICKRCGCTNIGIERHTGQECAIGMPSVNFFGDNRLTCP